MEIHRVYKTFKDPAFPLVIYRCPRTRSLPKFVNFHWHSTLELIYIPEGEYEVYDENEKYMAQAGGLIIFPPSKPHTIRAVSQTSEYWSIHFSLDLITMSKKHFFQQEFVEPLYTASLQMPRYLAPEQITEQMHQAIFDLTHSKERWKQFQSLMFLCTQLMPLCKKTESKHPMHTGHTAIQECIRYIEANYSNDLTLQELADHVHLHPNYLSSLFKKDTGQSLFDFLYHVRIYTARNLLLNPNLSISQIAELTGFKSADFFCRKFKQIIGTTPNAYRKNNYNP